MDSTVNLAAACALLNDGNVVGLPTETVYGLAGRIDNQEALLKIFKTKERPFFDPLIVHVDSVSQAQMLTTDWNPLAQRLAETFWPGPLTLVLPKSPTVNDLITSGLDSVGVRCPKHPLALRLIREVGVPLAAPSANRFGKTSPTTAAHVRSELPQVFVLDGGPCEVGIESTVIKIEGTRAYVLRPGAIGPAQLRSALGELPFSLEKAVDKKASPGHLDHHYMPDRPLIYSRDLNFRGDGRVGVLNLPDDPTTAARLLYAELRRLSQTFDSILFLERPIHTTPEWEGILDRLLRAASRVV